MARLRDEHEEFTGRGAVVLAVGPNARAVFEHYWQNEGIPFIGLPDPEHSVARLYRQEVKLFKWGRMPFNCIVDGKGHIRYAHYGKSMSDIPSNEELLQVIDDLNASSE